MAACLNLHRPHFAKMLRHFCSPPAIAAPPVSGRLPRSSTPQSYESKSRIKALEMKQALKLKKAVADTVKPPLAVAGVEGRFATALYSAAIKLDKLSDVEKDMNSLKTTLQNNPEIMQFLSESTKTRHSKKVFVEDLGKEMQLSDTVVKLFSMLADNGKINKTFSVLSAFEILMDAHRGVIKGSVVSAQPLSESEFADLKFELSSRFVEEGFILELSTTVDPSLIEGTKITIKDTIIDMSLESRIDSIFSDMEEDNKHPVKDRKKKKKKRKGYDRWNEEPK